MAAETALEPAGREPAATDPAAQAGLIFGLLVALLCGIAWLWGVEDESYYLFGALAGGALAGGALALLGCGIYLYAERGGGAKVGGGLFSAAARNAATLGVREGAAMMQQGWPPAARAANVASMVRLGSLPGVPLGAPMGTPLGVPMGGLPSGM